jgi:hypothetical protein
MSFEEDKEKRRVENEKKSVRIFGLILILIGFFIAFAIPNIENGGIQFILGFFIVPALLIIGFIYVVDN